MAWPIVFMVKKKYLKRDKQLKKPSVLQAGSEL